MNGAAMNGAAIVQMCGRSHNADALMRRKGVKKEARTSALRAGTRMVLAAIEQMSGGSIEWCHS